MLGTALTPYGYIPGSYPTGITKSYKGATSWQQPFDPQFYTRGEAGYYYDTPLGGSVMPLRQKWWSKFGAKLTGLGHLPTDFELAHRRGYLPRMSGWVTTAQGYQPGAWQPMTGHYPGSPPATWMPMAPRPGVNGLGDVPPSPATAEDLVAVMAAHNDRILALTLVSTAAVATSALITIFRTLRLIKSGDRG